MTEWQEVALGDLGEVITGRTPPARSPEAFGNVYPFVTPTDMHDQRVMTHTERYLSEVGADSMRRLCVPAGSVMVSCIGWQLGKVAIAATASFTNQQLNTVIPDDAVVDPRFLYYHLCTRRAEIRQLASGGTRTPILNKSRFAALRVSLPPRAVQRAIAEVLTCIDESIENNRRRVEMLEEMARTIYREWFVRFRFPGHECVELVDSDSGPVPDGWTIGTLGELAVEIRDAVSASAATEAIPYVPIDVIDRRSITLKNSRPGSEAASSLRLFRAGDVLFGAMRAYFHKVCVAPFDGVTRSTCFVLRPDPERYQYAVMTLADDGTVAYAASHSSGSTIPYAKWSGVLSEMAVILPPVSVARTFGEAIEPLLGLARVLSGRSAHLATMRDLLLRKLVTGQIDVSALDLDALVEGAVA
jgi:type I restriction enzyme, S subunit